MEESKVASSLSIPFPLLPLFFLSSSRIGIDDHGIAREVDNEILVRGEISFIDGWRDGKRRKHVTQERTEKREMVTGSIA